MTDPDLVLELEENALDSLRHAVTHFTDEEENTFIKYVVLHTVHAVELYLKARLARDHPLLIYDRPENAPVDQPKNTSQLDGISFFSVWSV